MGIRRRVSRGTLADAPGIDFKRIEAPMDPALAEEIYELDRCIECGCCVAGCGTARMRKTW